MSHNPSHWEVTLLDRQTGEPVQVKGTDATMSVSYSDGRLLMEALGMPFEELLGMAGTEAIIVLKRACARAERGRVLHTLATLLDWVQEHPDGLLEVF